MTYLIIVWLCISTLLTPNPTEIVQYAAVPACVIVETSGAYRFALIERYHNDTYEYSSAVYFEDSSSAEYCFDTPHNTSGDYILSTVYGYDDTGSPVSLSTGWEEITINTVYVPSVRR